MPGIELEDALQRPHLADHPVAREEVVERELARADAPLHLRLLVHLDRGLGLLDQREHVAHAEDPRRHAVGMEVLELVELLAHRDELHRPPGDRPHRERRAAARVAVELRQDDAVECDRSWNASATFTASWPGHRVEDEEHVRRLRLVGDPLELVHQLLVDVQPARGVEDHDVEPVLAGGVEPEPRRLDGIASVERVDRDLDLPAELLELVDRRRALEVAGDERRALASFRRSSASFAAAVVLPEPCRPASRITVGGRPNASRESPEPIRAVSSSWTIFTTCWPGVRLFSTSWPSARSLTVAVKSLRDLEVDVRLEQREPDLAHRLRDRLLVEAAAAAEAAERRLELVGQRVEHGRSVRRAPSARVDVARTSRLVGDDRHARPLPAGRSRFLFADVEGSTRLLHLLGERFAPARGRMRELVRAGRGGTRGAEVDWAGDGVFLAFARARGRDRGRRRDPVVARSCPTSKSLRRVARRSVSQP